MANETMMVEVAYALPEMQSLLSVEVDNGCTAIDAVKQSGILELHTDIELEQIQMGIFSKACNEDQILQAGDRVEIYRPLIADPKEVRKKRAAEAKERRSASKD